jgi:hypothetical protein
MPDEIHARLQALASAAHDCYDLACEIDDIQLRLITAEAADGADKALEAYDYLMRKRAAKQRS